MKAIATSSQGYQHSTQWRRLSGVQRSELTCLSDEPPTTAALFQELPNYIPSSCWLDGDEPQHLHFDEHRKITSLVGVIKTHLLSCITEGCQLLLHRAGHNDLLSRFDHDMRIWHAAISMQKYGVVYLGSRTDCFEEFLPLLEAEPARFESIDRFLQSDANWIRAINYGVHRWVRSEMVRVDTHAKLIPPRAIASFSLHHVAMRPQDLSMDGSDLLDKSEPLWDLHDFAHHTAAALAPDLYGSKYFTHLTALPPELTALIRSPRMATAQPHPCFSDGVLFSELLTPLFESEVESVLRGHKYHTYASIVETLGQALAAYLTQGRQLRHDTTGVMLRMEHNISPKQLAVLAQNKAYELPASEMEQRVLTRGGPSGDGRDELDLLSAAARIRFLARSRRWMYFEARNTLKHRAQKLAYRIVAETMLTASEPPPTLDDRRLLQLILEALTYREIQDQKVVDLWGAVLLTRDC